MSQVLFVPRGKYVLLRILSEKSIRGIAMPGNTTVGTRFIVEAIGDKVTDLDVGDEVMMLPNAFATRPDESQEHAIVKAGFIIATVKREPVDHDLSA